MVERKTGERVSRSPAGAERDRFWPVVTGNKWFRRLIVWGGLVIVYQLAAQAAGPFFLPTVPAIGRGFVELIDNGSINTLWPALVQLALGFGLAVAIGVPVGIAMGMSQIIDDVVGMYVKALFVTSLVAVLPLMIIIFGYGLVFRIAVVFLFAVFFIILTVSAGVRDVDSDLRIMGRSFAISKMMEIRSIVLPSSVPFIISGARLGLANAFSGMILAQLWVTRDLGMILTQLGLNRDLPKFFAIIIVVTIIAGVAAVGLKLLEVWVTPWNRARGSR